MFDLPSWRIGRIFGIPVEVNASWVLIFVLVTVSLTFNYYPLVYPDRAFAVNVFSGLITALLFFGSIVLHEAAHSIVARAGGTGISKITLFAFGGVAQMEEEPSSPGREFVMAVAGPGMSLVLAAFSFGVFFWLITLGASDILWGPFEYLAVINVGVAVFNLLPGFPLDGGRVLRAMLWRATGDLLKATRWATAMGRGIGWMMVGAGLLGAVMGQLNLVWFAVLGWFLTTMAGGAYREQVLRTRLSTVSVGEEMTSPATVVDGTLTIQESVDRYLLGGSHSQYPVAVAGEIVGMLHMSAVKETPREQWSTTRLTEVSSHDIAELTTAPQTPVDAIVGRMGPDGPGAMIVVDEGRLVGVITRSDVMRALRRLSQSQGPASPT